MVIKGSDGVCLQRRFRLLRPIEGAEGPTEGKLLVSSLEWVEVIIKTRGGILAALSLRKSVGDMKSLHFS